MNDLDLRRISQHVIYAAVINHDCDYNGTEFYEVLVREMNVRVSALSLEEAIDKAETLLQSKLTSMNAARQAIPSPVILSSDEIAEICKYGQRMICLDAEVVNYM